MRPLALYGTVVSIVALVLCARAASAQAAYSIRQLTAPGLAHGYAFDIDNSGNVVGEMNDAGGLPHAVVWRNGIATVLPGLTGGVGSSARAVHDDGTIGGYGANAVTPTSAAVWLPNAMGGWSEVDLGIAPGNVYAMVLGIHGGGFACGYADDGLFTLPVAWSGVSGVPSMVLLPMPVEAFGGAAYAALPQQRAVGYVDGSFGVRPVQWSVSGATPTLLQLPALSSWGIATDGNANDLVVGASISPVTGRIHSVQWQGGVLEDLGTVPGQDCYPESVNDQGVIVGWSRTFSTPPYVAVIKRPGEGIRALQQLLPAGTDWTLVRAEGINNRGEIVGVGVRNGFFEPFLLTPVTVALSAPVPGLVGQNNTLSVAGGSPQSFSLLCASLLGGETIVPGCVQGLDLLNPLILGVVLTDSKGHSSHTLSVPAVIAQIPVYFQAYDWPGCRTSNVAPFTFP